MPDVPDLRCVTVRANQMLRVVNTSNDFAAEPAGPVGMAVIISFADFAPRTVPIGQATMFDEPFASFLAPGHHVIYVSVPAGTPCPAAAPAFCHGHGYAAELILG